MRKAAAKLGGETEDGACSCISCRRRAGSGGPKGEWGGRDAKSISNGQSEAIESWKLSCTQNRCAERMQASVYTEREIDNALNDVKTSTRTRFRRWSVGCGHRWWCVECQ
jgi:hypothetical protein